MPEGVDPNLLQDFLTEAGELIETLDADLVKLEAEPRSQALLDQIFRALHTIKGAASFLNMEAVTTFAHAAEDALNRLRKGELSVDQRVMDVMLRSVDVLRGQLGSLGEGEEPAKGPEDLIEQLHAITAMIPGATPPARSEPKVPATPALATQAPATPAAAAAPKKPGPVDLAADAASTELKLSPEKADVLTFMVSDLLESTRQVDAAVESLRAAATRGEGAARLREIADSMQPTADYYGFAFLNRLVSIVAAGGAALGQGADRVVGEACVRLLAVQRLLVAYADGLGNGRELSWPIDTLEQRFGDLCCGQELDAALMGAHGGGVDAVLRLDGVVSGGVVAADASAGTPSSVAAASASEPGDTPGEHPTVPEPADKAGEEQAGREGEKGAANAAAHAEQTVRVEVSRLEALLNLVGEMVLTKNQILGQTRVLRDHGLPHDVMENFAGVVSDLDRLTAELQVGVMRTRMQPLSKLFGRYPRIIRDLARKTGKNVHLEITGGDTEVDKSVLELLGDPLVHMLRNSVDHGLEGPDGRASAGKPATGTIELSAEHQGGHVRVMIRDDGRGIDRERVATKAIERGMVTADAAASMSDSDVFRFIFAPGLSTADQVSDLSGRGVGMDVVQTNIAKLGGTINVSSVKGRGTTIEITIPLTVAIMRAMMVGVGAHDYAVPVMSIHEIVKPEASSLHSVASRPVMRLRESVLPLIDLRETLVEAKGAPGQGFAVVIGVGSERAGLIVDRLVGQQEVVIKPLDDTYAHGGPFSGATIREDGNVSLILDVVKLVRSAQAGGKPQG